MIHLGRGGERLYLLLTMHPLDPLALAKLLYCIWIIVQYLDSNPPPPPPTLKIATGHFLLTHEINPRNTCETAGTCRAYLLSSSTDAVVLGTRLTRPMPYSTRSASSLWVSFFGMRPALCMHGPTCTCVCLFLIMWLSTNQMYCNESRYIDSVWLAV